MGARRPSGARRGRWALAALIVALIAPVALVGSVGAANSVRSGGHRTVVVGTTVTVSATVTASPAVQAAQAGFCIRATGDVSFDLLKTQLLIPAGGVVVELSGSLRPGRYRVWTCAEIAGSWQHLDTPSVVTVSVPSIPPTASLASVAPSGVSMPAGNLPGWRQVFAEDFTSRVPRGGFPGPYASRWMSYHGFSDTRGGGDYNQRIIEIGDGVLDLHLRTENGRAQVAAPIPLVGGDWGGQTYGKFTVRFRAERLPGFYLAWLLWPDSEVWADGEINFPEGNLGGTMAGYVHCVGNPSRNCAWTYTGVPFTGWHTADLEWTPSGITMALDGRTVLTTAHAPTKPMHWVLQTETASSKPDPAVEGHVQIDWVTIYRWTG